MTEHVQALTPPPGEVQQAVGGEIPRPGAPTDTRHPPLTPVPSAGTPAPPAGATPVSSRPHAPDEDVGDTVSLDPRDIKIDAARFQFKSGGDAQGVSDQLNRQAQGQTPRLHALVLRETDGISAEKTMAIGPGAQITAMPTAPRS